MSWSSCRHCAPSAVGVPGARLSWYCHHLAPRTALLQHSAMTTPTIPDDRAPGQRRTELAAFLRARRARITPTDVGLPPGMRRRTLGLRREEVAQLAGVGLTWYTWLEQGRPIRVSVQVLDAVARALRLDHAELEHLYRLSDIPIAPPDVVVETVPPAAREILDSLDPLPAALLKSRFDVLASNESRDYLFG